MFDSNIVINAILMYFLGLKEGVDQDNSMYYTYHKESDLSEFDRLCDNNYIIVHMDSYENEINVRLVFLMLKYKCDRTPRYLDDPEKFIADYESILKVQIHDDDKIKLRKGYPMTWKHYLATFIKKEKSTIKEYRGDHHENHRKYYMIENILNILYK